MTKIFITTPRPSEGAYALAKSLGAKVLKNTGSKHVFSPKNSYINWGRSTYHPALLGDGRDVDDIKIYNRPTNIQPVVHKLRFFESANILGDIPIPRFLDPGPEPIVFAREFINSWECSQVCVRTDLTGHSGNGLSIVNTADITDDQIVEACNGNIGIIEYIPKREEYRVHFGYSDLEGPQILLTQRKARNLDVPDRDIDWQIRNHANGFIYQREFEYPTHDFMDVVNRIVHNICEGFQLDFGAIDLIWNSKRGFYVLEVNTAPGIDGSTIDTYTNFFQTEINNALLHL